MIPAIQTPTWHLPLLPSACPGPQPHHREVQQPQEKEPAPEQKPESEAVVPEAPQPLGKVAESIYEPPPLEPSQTVNLPKPTITDSPSSKPAATVETPQLTSEKEPEPVKSQDVLAEEKHSKPSASLGTSVYVKPSVSATVDKESAPPTEEKPNIDASNVEINAVTPTQAATDLSPVPHPTTSPYTEHPDLPLVPESGTASTEVSLPTPDTVTEPEPSESNIIIDNKMEDLAEDVSTSSGGSGRPTTPTPSSPTLPSVSDIYAEPPNGTEQNGNPVHGSSQKESVFMRLNNRIKALEMNMSLSGRYLEQLSQR